MHKNSTIASVLLLPNSSLEMTVSLPSRPPCTCSAFTIALLLLLFLPDWSIFLFLTRSLGATFYHHCILSPPLLPLFVCYLLLLLLLIASLSRLTFRPPLCPHGSQVWEFNWPPYVSRIKNISAHIARDRSLCDRVISHSQAIISFHSFVHSFINGWWGLTLATHHHGQWGGSAADWDVNHSFYKHQQQ